MRTAACLLHCNITFGRIKERGVNMSNRLFQTVIHQMRQSIDRTIGVVDESSVIIACSELGKIGEVIEDLSAESLNPSSAVVVNGYT